MAFDKWSESGNTGKLNWNKVNQNNISFFRSRIEKGTVTKTNPYHRLCQHSGHHFVDIRPGIIIKEELVARNLGIQSDRTKVKVTLRNQHQRNRKAKLWVLLSLNRIYGNLHVHDPNHQTNCMTIGSLSSFSSI